MPARRPPDYAASPHHFSRREAALELGLSYSILRVYEKHLEGWITPVTGRNRTQFYTSEDLDTLREAVGLRDRGFKFTQLSDQLRLRERPQIMRLLTERDVLEMLRIGRSTLYRLREDGLPVIHLGRLIRYDQDEVLAWVRASQGPR